MMTKKREQNDKSLILVLEQKVNFKEGCNGKAISPLGHVSTNINLFLHTPKKEAKNVSVVQATCREKMV